MSRPTDAGLYLRGSDTLLASWEAYARGAVGAAVKHLPGVATAVFPHEPERAVYNNALLERDLGPAGWAEYLRMDGLPPDFLEHADHATFHLLAARTDGEMVAAALAYDFGDDCGIYNVGTVEKARRRGLGTALTAAQAYGAQAYGARARGCRTASLQSTPMAERMYAAVGFRDLGRILEYVPPKGDRR
jgi:ribosomal protein S18 acetylase RimI-like enzyme